MNRAERRAIAQGKGRHVPMIEVINSDTADDYAFSLTDWERGKRMLNNTMDLFISRQLSYLEIRDEFMEDPYLLH